MISRHDLFNKTLGELVDLNKRIAVPVQKAVLRLLFLSISWQS